MSRLNAPAWSVLFAAALLIPAMLFGQSADDADEGPRGRLPNHFGKLGVTEEQRERIYAIQADYNEQIEELLSQIEALRTQRDDEIESILTPGQKLRLQELRDAERAEREAETADAEAGDDSQ